MSRVKEIREQRGLRREQLAAEAGISLYYVRRLEADANAPSLGVARRIAMALGVSVDEAFPPERGAGAAA